METTLEGQASNGEKSLQNRQEFCWPVTNGEEKPRDKKRDENNGSTEFAKNSSNKRNEKTDWREKFQRRLLALSRIEITILTSQLGNNGWI